MNSSKQAAVNIVQCPLMITDFQSFPFRLNAAETRIKFTVRGLAPEYKTVSILQEGLVLRGDGKYYLYNITS